MSRRTRAAMQTITAIMLLASAAMAQTSEQQGTPEGAPATREAPVATPKIAVLRATLRCGAGAGSAAGPGP